MLSTWTWKKRSKQAVSFQLDPGGAGRVARAITFGDCCLLAVILSGVGGSRSEAAAESKDPLPVGSGMSWAKEFLRCGWRGGNSSIRLCWD